jgi:hypothetical protein
MEILDDKWVIWGISEEILKIKESNENQYTTYQWDTAKI